MQVNTSIFVAPLDVSPRFTIQAKETRRAGEMPRLDPASSHTGPSAACRFALAREGSG